MTLLPLLHLTDMRINVEPDDELLARIDRICAATGMSALAVEEMLWESGELSDSPATT